MLPEVTGISGGMQYMTATKTVQITVTQLNSQPMRPILKLPERGRNRAARLRQRSSAAGKANDNCSTRTPVPQRLLKAKEDKSDQYLTK